MKSKVQTPAHPPQKRSDVMKNSSHSFLENERYHTVVERERPEENSGKNGTCPPGQQSDETCEKSTPSLPMTERVHQKTQSEQISQSHERVEPGLFAPKRYVTTCYFQPKQHPVLYSETMILKIGSTKKKYFESVYYVTKLSPFHWSETMTTILPGTGEPIIFASDVNIPLGEPAFHYMSLEPQQVAAMEKMQQNVEINYV